MESLNSLTQLEISEDLEKASTDDLVFSTKLFTELTGKKVIGLDLQNNEVDKCFAEVEEFLNHEKELSMYYEELKLKDKNMKEEIQIKVKTIITKLKEDTKEKIWQDLSNK